jgi:hypothetical protein
MLGIKGLHPDIRFRFKTAKHALRLLNGDTSIERHPLPSVQQYETYSYPNFPNVRQLFVLACRLGKVDTASFMEAMMGELCHTEEKWRKWAAPFLHTKFHAIASQESIGQALEVDQYHGRLFVQSFVDVLEGGDSLPIPHSGKIVVPLMRAYIKKRTDQMLSVTEALFMMMRGHNNELLNEEEPNRPACAEGVYLGLLRAITERMTTDEYFLMLDGLNVDRCS